MKYTDQYLLDSIKEKAGELGRTPGKRELAHYQAIVKRFGTLANALHLCNLIPNRQFIADLETYINVLHTFVNKHGRTPTKDDFYKDKSLPDPSIVQKRFKMTWTELLERAGYKSNIKLSNAKELSKKDAFTVFRQQYSKMNNPTSHEYDKLRDTGTPSVSFIINKTGLTWNQLLKKIGVQHIHYDRYTRKDLIVIIQELHKSLNHIPSIVDLEQSGHSKQAFIREFESWPNALREAGLTGKYQTPVDVPESNNELIQMYKKFSKRIYKTKHGASCTDLDRNDDIYNYDVFHLRFGGINELRIQAGFQPLVTRRSAKKYTKDNIAKLLLNEYKKNNRRLTNSEIQKNQDLPAIKTMCATYQTTKMSQVWDSVLNKGGLNAT